MVLRSHLPAVISYPFNIFFSQTLNYPAEAFRDSGHLRVSSPGPCIFSMMVQGNLESQRAARLLESVKPLESD